MIATLFVAGTDVPWPHIVERVVKRRPFLDLFLHAVRNTAAGALASFLLWASFNPNSSLSSDDITLAQIGAALVLGTGGTATINALVQQKQKSDAVNDMADSIATLADLYKNK